MIFYDPDPLQLLQQESADYVTIELPSGGVLLAQPTGHYDLKIISLHSTDPQDFLESRYQPGQMLKMTVVPSG